MPKSQIYNTNINNKLYEYYISRWGMKDGKNGWVIGDCPECGKERKWGVNIDQGKTNCFICGRGSSPLKRIGELENLDTFAQIMNFIKAYEGIEYRVATEEAQVSILKFPEHYYLISQGKSEYATVFRNYMRGRGFKITYLRNKGVGYCTEGTHAGRIIIPYYRQGKLVYFNARDIFDTGMKFLNPKEEDIGYGKSQVVYNWDALYIYTKVYLMESATNALTIGDRGIGFGGKILSQWQISEILRSPIKEAVILWDDDAIEDGYRLALRICDFKRVKVVHMPVGIDVNKLGRKATLELVNKTEFKDSRQLRKIYLDLKST